MPDSLVKRIRQLNRAVKKLKAFRIEDFDSTPEFLKGDPDEGEKLQEWDEGSIDSTLLCVSEEGFNFSGYIKHTDIHIETEEFTMEELSENIKVMKSKSLPLLLGHLKYDSSKTLLEQRLKGE